jgi:hypothetical protein
MIARHIEPVIEISLSDTPVVLLNGARQTGKSTLAQKIAAKKSGGYYTLDDSTTLMAATNDPQGFLSSLGNFAVIDEVQKAPKLFPALKLIVDRQRKPGRFLLTGSTNVLLIPQLSESLAGRMEIISLWPLSQGELRNRKEDFLDQIFQDSPFSNRRLDPNIDNFDLEETLIHGGYPEPLERKNIQRRGAWFSSYVTTILQRDIRDLSRIEGLTEMPRVLTILASRTANLLNYSDLSRDAGIPQSTLKRYLALLEMTFLFQPLLAWSNNIGKRLMKSPKTHLVDVGLCSHLLGVDSNRLRIDPTLAGHLLETFVVNELRKQASWSSGRYSFFHFRTLIGKEVDLVIEDSKGHLAAIEIKASDSLHKSVISGLQEFRLATGKRFSAGVVLYKGRTIVPFGDRIWAVPISSLWS